MTREMALAATRTLDKIDSFNDFMEEVQEAVNHMTDFCGIDKEFESKLWEVIYIEQRRIAAELEAL